MKTLKVLTGICSVIMFLSAVAFLIFGALEMGTAAAISIGSFFVFLAAGCWLDMVITDRELAGRHSEEWERACNLYMVRQDIQDIEDDLPF